MIGGMFSFLRLEEMWRGLRFWRFFSDVHVGQGPDFGHFSHAFQKSLIRSNQKQMVIGPLVPL